MCIDIGMGVAKNIILAVAIGIGIISNQSHYSFKSANNCTALVKYGRVSGLLSTPN